MINRFTDEDLSGTGVGPEHGPAKGRLNEVIDQINLIAQNLVDAVIAVADAPAGATAAALTADLKDVNGNALAKVGVFLIEASTTLYHGARTPNAHITFGTPSKGSVLADDHANGWWLVKTDANGQFAVNASNSSDETVYFSCTTAPVGVDALAHAVAIRGCVPDDATWSA
jgi:hypothetical protein